MKQNKIWKQKSERLQKFCSAILYAYISEFQIIQLPTFTKYLKNFFKKIVKLKFLIKNIKYRKTFRATKTSQVVFVEHTYKPRIHYINSILVVVFLFIFIIAVAAIVLSYKHNMNVLGDYKCSRKKHNF